MGVLRSTDGWRGNVRPLVGLAVQLRAPGDAVRAGARPVGAAGAGGDAPATTGVVPPGGWR
jgi:hypothetical protein